MRKRLLLLIMGTILMIPLKAQLDFGPKAGINISHLKTSQIETNDFRISAAPGNQIGYHVGLFLRASLFGLFVQPELVYSSLTTELNVEDLNTAAEQLAQQQIGRIDVPVLIGARLGALRLGVGPVASVVVSSKSELLDLTGYEEQFKSATFGYQLGLGADIWKLSIDGRYEGNLSSLGDGIEVGGRQLDFDGRTQQFIISLAYSF